MEDRVPLTEVERAEVNRLFSRPFFIPPAFKNWVAGQLAQKTPEIPMGTLFGGRGIARALHSGTASVAASGAGTTDFYSTTIQGRTLGANGRIRFVAEFTLTSPDASNDNRIYLVFGGTTLCSITDHTSGTAERHLLVEGEIYNANSPSVQFGRMGYARLTSGASVLNSFVANSNGQSAIDTTVDQLLKLRGDWAAGSADDVMTMVYINIEIVNPIPFGAA